MYNVGGYEWSRECADAGDALCQYTYGWRVHLHPTLSQEMKDSLRNEWMQKSANGGFAQGMFTVGRSELGTTHEIASLLLFIIICHGSFFSPFFRTLYSGVEFLLLLLFFERGAEARGTNCFRPELWRWWPESTPAVHPRGCTLYDLVYMLMHAWCIPMLAHVSKVDRTIRPLIILIIRLQIISTVSMI